MKAVLLQRRGANRIALTHFATKDIPEGTNMLETLGDHLKALLHDLGGTAKALGIAFSSEEAMVRIIEQNTIPPELLRDALRINGPMLLNQDCREWVIDCAAISPKRAPVPAAEKAEGDTATKTDYYLVGGLPRTHVQHIYEACVKNKILASVLQLPPVALINGFEFANPQTFQSQAFVLVDVGHLSSTVIVGAKEEIVLIRSLGYGGNHFMEELILHGAASFEEIVTMLAEEEVLTVEIARQSLSELVRLISSSIGFFEARSDEAISKVFVSGGLAKLPTVIKTLAEELRLPCEAWDPFANCELNLPRARVGALTEHLPVLGVACGVAVEILQGR